MDRTINVILKPLRRFAMQKPNASILLFMAMIPVSYTHLTLPTT